MKTIALIATLFLIPIILGILFAYPFMILWNHAIVKAISIANPIDFWTSVCLVLFLSFFHPAATGSKE